MSNTGDSAKPGPSAGFAAGVVAGASGVLVGHAFDTAKVQQQLGRTLDEKTFSLRFLYRGIVPPLVSTGAVRSVYFGLYEALRPAASRMMEEPRDGLGTVFVAASMTGTLVAPLTAPMQRLKLVQQSQGLGLSECTRQIFASAGVGGFYRGLGLHCVIDTIGSGSYLLAYASAKRSFASARPAAAGGAPPREPLGVRVGCGAVAGIFGWLSIYPLDVLRSRVMSAPPSAAGGGGFATVARVARETYARGGVAAFFSGMSLTLLRAAPVAGVVLPVYDTVQDFLAARASTT